jgi:hypothetical protein
MMRDRFSLRNIPKDAERLAEAIHRQTNLSESDVCRLALMSGMLVEAARLPPEQNGTMGGMNVLYLAKALRRVLGPAIDLLWEQGEHPYQTLISGNKGASETSPSSDSSSHASKGHKNDVSFEHSIQDDLDQLGIGFGLSEALGNDE